MSQTKEYDYEKTKIETVKLILYIIDSEFRACPKCEEFKKTEVYNHIEALPEILGLKDVEYYFELKRCEWEFWDDDLIDEREMEKIENYLEHLAQFEGSPAIKMYIHYNNGSLQTYKLSGILISNIMNEKNSNRHFFKYLGKILNKERISEKYKKIFQHEKVKNSTAPDGDTLNKRLDFY